MENLEGVGKVKGLGESCEGLGSLALKLLL